MYCFREKLFIWFTLGLLILVTVVGVFGVSIAIHVGLFYVIQKIVPSWIVLSETFSYLSFALWNMGWFILNLFFAYTIIPLISLILKNRLSRKLLWVFKQSVSFFYIYLCFYQYDNYEEGIEVSFYGLLLFAFTFSLLYDVLDSNFLENQVKDLFKKKRRKQA